MIVKPEGFEYTIRMSMLPSVADCERRAVAGQYRELIESAGFQLRKRPANIRAAVGTAVHTVIADMLTQKRDTGRVGNVTNSVARAALLEEIKDGVQTDNVTTSPKDAFQQIDSMAAAFQYHLLPAIRPKLIEQRLYMDCGDGWLGTGEIDLYDENGFIHDHKTGKGSRVRPYHAQGGGYTLIMEANDHAVNGIEINRMECVAPGKAQPDPKVIFYEKKGAVAEARRLIDMLKTSVPKFAATGDPTVFNANLMSTLCTETYCDAWGTPFCPLSGDK